MRGREITMSMAGWLWADLLLGVFVLFAVANSAAVAVIDRTTVVPPSAAPPMPTASPVLGVDPKALEVTLRIDGPALLSGNGSAVRAEQGRVAEEVLGAVGARRVAFVLAYGSHDDLATGDRLAEIATAGLRDGPFAGAAIKAFHNYVAGDRGSALLLSLYFHQ